MVKLYLLLLREESGQGMAEYALMLALVSLALMTALSSFGNRLGGLYTGFLQMFP